MQVLTLTTKHNSQHFESTTLLLHKFQDLYFIIKRTSNFGVSTRWRVGMFVFSSRMDFLEMENRKLGKKVLHVSSQLAVLERRLQNRESADPAEVPTQFHSRQLYFLL